MKNWNRKSTSLCDIVIRAGLTFMLLFGIFGDIQPVSAHVLSDRFDANLQNAILPQFLMESVPVQAEDTQNLPVHEPKNIDPAANLWKSNTQASQDLIQSISVDPIRAGTSSRVSLILKNSGAAALYDLRSTITLPPGLLYVSGSTRWSITGPTPFGSGWLGPSIAYDPNPVYSPLEWEFSEIPALANLPSGETIRIEFEVRPDCPFAGGNLYLSTNYKNDEYGTAVYTVSSSTSLSYSPPNLNVILVSDNSEANPIDVNDAVSWNIQVTNESGYALPVVWVEADLGAAFTYSSSTGDATYGTDNGTNAGQTVAWELSNLPHGASAYLSITAVSDSSPCNPDLDVDVYTRWGLGAVDGSSSTKPGIDRPDDTACLNADAIHTSDTGTREPYLAFITPTFNPASIDNSDGTSTLLVGVENNGTTDAFNTDLVITLPPGLSLNNAISSKNGIGTDTSMSLNISANPSISGSNLTYYDINDMGSNLFSVLQAAGGNDTGMVSLSLEACDASALSEIGFQFKYYSACTDTQYTMSTTSNLTVLSPQLEVSQTFPTYLAPDNSTREQINISNSGTGAPGSNNHLTVVETLQSDLTYVTGSTMWRVNNGAWHGPDTAYDPTISGNDLTWTELILGFSPDTLIPNSSLKISFEIASNSSFTGSDLENSTSLELLCGLNTNKNTQNTITLQLLPNGPDITTDPASSITYNGATLNGTVNAIGESTDITFEYGLTDTYGTSVIADQSPLDTSTDSPVTFTLTNLTPNTEYHYRVVGVNSFGTTNGLDQTFTTLGTTITTEIHSDSVHTPVLSASINDRLHAMATVVGNGPQVTGLVSFTVYNNPSCYGTGIAAGSITLDASGVAEPSTSAILTENGLSFKAQYHGDSNYLAANGLCTPISTSAYPTILPLSTNTFPQNGELLASSLSNLIVQFNQDVLNGASTDPDSADNPLNYLLVEAGMNGVFDTSACGGSGGGLQPDDTQVPIDSVTYDPALFTAKLVVNNEKPLPDGHYRLFICGTTSIVNTDRTVYLNNHLNDSLIRFRVQRQSAQTVLPETGFTPDRVTLLPAQPSEKKYNHTNIVIQIPAIGIQKNVVGVSGPTWDISWLGDNIGYLEGTAFPTWNGNSVLAGHVANANGMPGPFANLSGLKWGDQLIIHAWGQQYIYEVRSVDLWISPKATAVLNKHEEIPWLTLITCHGYNERTDSYRWRTIVRAVLIKIKE